MPPVQINKPEIMRYWIGQRIKFQKKWSVNRNAAFTNVFLTHAAKNSDARNNLYFEILTEWNYTILIGLKYLNKYNNISVVTFFWEWLRLPFMSIIAQLVHLNKGRVSLFALLPRAYKLSKRAQKRFLIGMSLVAAAAGLPWQKTSQIFLCVLRFEWQPLAKRSPQIFEGICAQRTVGTN
jgi:hypothetical protein